MCFRCSCQIMNFTRMLGSLVIKKHVVCRRSLAQLFLCSGVGCVATWVRCQARGRTRCAGAREPALGCSARARPAACSGSSFSLPPVPPAGCLQRSNPGAGQSSEDAIKGRTLPVEEGGGGFAGTLAECPCERLPRCEWGFSSVARRLGNVSGSTSVAPASSPHDGRFSGTPSLSCTVCARPTPTGEVRGAGEGLRSRGRTRRAPRPGPDARASGGQSSPG